MDQRRLSIPYSLLAAVALSGCSSWGDVPTAYRVDSGLEPQHIDEHVRFRTTYYFRVLTGCRIDTTKNEDLSTDGSPFIKRVKGEFVPLSDSLYRFRMTGQTAALFNKVHFESGVLRKEQIDPFGSAVRYNEDTNSFIPVSAEELRHDARREAAIQDIDRIRKLYKDINADTTLTSSDKTALLAKLLLIIEDRLDTVKNTLPFNTSNPTPQVTSPSGSSPATAQEQAKPGDQPAADTSKELETTKKALAEAQKQLEENQTKEKAVLTDLNGKIEARLNDLGTDQKSKRASADGDSANCNGRPSTTKYYLLGPEGSKELDPNDRLLMALSVDSRPLIGMLQQISEHKFQSAGSELKVMEDLLQERGRIYDAHMKLLKAKEDALKPSGPTDESRLELLLNALRETFAATSTK